MNTLKLMKFRQTGLTVLAVVCLLMLLILLNLPRLKSAIGTSLPVSADKNRPAVDAAKKTLIRENYGKLPLSFEANQGQTDSRVKFLSRGAGYTFFLTATEAVMELRRADDGQSSMGDAQTSVDSQSPARPQQSATLRLKLAGANQNPRIAGADELPGKSNYFLGNDANAWKTDVPNYARVKYEDVYPGIDVVYYGNQQQLEYDFHLAPGADPKRIRLSLAGARKLRLDEKGDLLIETTAGQVRQHRPIVYQEIDGRRQEVTGSYMLRGKSEVAFEVGAYDASRPLVIDPVLSYSTWLSLNYLPKGIAVDAAGNAYITGSATLTFPTTPGALRPSASSSQGTFVSVLKLNPAGTAAVYSALIGGTGALINRSGRSVLGNRGEAIALDAAGNAYVTGFTQSSNFPTTPGAVRSSYDTTDAGQGIFALKINSTGNQLVYSTLLGSGSGAGIAVDAQGDAYVAGVASTRNTQATPDFTTTPGAFQTAFVGGGSDAFVAKLNNTGTALLYSTFLGSGADDRATGLVLDAAGNAYVTGRTANGELGGGQPDGERFPVTPNAYKLPTGLGGVFVTKLNPTGSALVYSTTLTTAGVSTEYPSLAVDAAGSAYIAGSTRSPNHPTTPGAYQTGGGSENPAVDNSDIYVVKLSADGSALVYSTYLGAPDYYETAGGIAVDAQGNAYVTGRYMAFDGDGADNGLLVTKLNAAGSALVYNLRFYLGQGLGIKVDAQGSAYVIGIARPPFPITPGAYNTTFEGQANANDNGIVTKIAESGGVPIPPYPTLPTPTPRAIVFVGGRITDQNGNPLRDIPVLLQSSVPVEATETSTNANGQYSLKIPSTGMFTVTPWKPGLESTPASRSFNNPAWHVTASFTMRPATGPTPTPTPTPTPRPLFTISGRVTTLAGQPMGGVEVALVGVQTNTKATDANGNYSFTNVQGGYDWVVAAYRSGTPFHPEGYLFERLNENKAASFVTWPSVQALTNLSAASYADKLAADSIVTAFGLNLATTTQVATANPLPTNLAGTSVKVRDMLGVERAAPLFFVSPTQVNYLTPPGTAAGLAIVTITNGNGATSSALAEVEPVAPGLFTADASGRGLAAAVALRIRADGTQVYEPIARYDAAQGKTVAVPIDLGPATDQVFLIFYGTGFRHRSAMTAVTAQIGGASGVAAPVLFAGEQGGFVGLDQANVLLPRTLVGRGEVDVVMSADGRAANTVKVWIK